MRPVPSSESLIIFKEGRYRLNKKLLFDVGREKRKYSKEVRSKYYGSMRRGVTVSNQGN